MLRAQGQHCALVAAVEQRVRVLHERRSPGGKSGTELLAVDVADAVRADQPSLDELLERCNGFLDRRRRVRRVRELQIHVVDAEPL